AGGQQRRGRHAFVDGVGTSSAGPKKLAVAGIGCPRRIHVHRRLHYQAGASMFIGDSMITPAISVLSAVEGLKLAAPALEHYVVPATVFILVVLFSVQRGGTARVASSFGPVMIVWFATLPLMGLVHIS